MSRCVRYAFELARARARENQLHLVAKTNVLTYVHGTWWRAFNEIGDADFPDITRDYAHVDAATMWMVKNPSGSTSSSPRTCSATIITDLAR